MRQGQHHFLDQSSEADASLSDSMNLARLSISSVKFHKQYSVPKFHICVQKSMMCRTQSTWSLTEGECENYLLKSVIGPISLSDLVVFSSQGKTLVSE